MAQVNRNTTEVLSVSLPKQLKKDVIKYARSRDLSVSQLTKEVLQNYILRNDLERIQKSFAPVFKKLGIKSDEDVEKYFG